MTGIAFWLAVAAAGAAPCPPEPAAGMVARAAPFGGAIAPTAAEADEAAAAGILAQGAARRFLALEPPLFLIAPDSAEAPPSPGGCAFVFPWRFAPGGEGRARPPAHVLPHEIGHTLFIRFLAPRSGAEEYGGGAPDWLDEMAAMAFENDAGIRMRRSEARRHAMRGALIPLARLLAMPHPEWSARRAAARAAGDSPLSQPGSADTPAYYATVRALFDFLVERTGDQRVIRRLAEEVRAGRPIDRWLLAHAAPAGAARSLGRLDAQLAAFVLTSSAYADAAPPAPEKPS